MNAEQRVLIIDSELKNCKAIKSALTEYGSGAYYTLSVIQVLDKGIIKQLETQGQAYNKMPPLETMCGVFAYRQGMA